MGTWVAAPQAQFRQAFNPGLDRCCVRYRTDPMGATAQTASLAGPMIATE